MSDLDWPEGFDRTPAADRRRYPGHFEVSRSRAFDSIVEELEKMDAVNVQVETAAPHTAKHPHRPYQDREPDDPGVVVRWERDGRGYVAPCDRWDNLRDNARAIALYLDAKRAIERYGVSTLEGEFATQALPDPDDVGEAADPPPHQVLGVSPDAPEPVVKGAARSLKAEHHPDAGGDEATFKQVVRAERALLEEQGER